MIRWSLIFFTSLVLMGCAHEVAQFIGVGAPVSKERCESLDLNKMGFADGELGQKNGDKFSFWEKDCRQVGLKLDRDAYDKGYADGLLVYCGCESGFKSGVHDEVLGFKGQYFMCSKAQFKFFEDAHVEGAKLKDDATLVQKGPAYQINYQEELIQAKASAFCSQSNK